METTNANVTGIYQIARLVPVSLKYYGLCLLPGSYNVNLHFAEIMYSDDQTYSSLGSRLFNVSVLGEVQLKDFDIAATAGGAGKSVIKVFKNVDVSDITLEIFLYWAGQLTTAISVRGAYDPLLSRISVTPNFRVNSGLSAGAIAGIVITSFVVLLSVLAILWLRGFLGGKDDENEGAFRKPPVF